VSKGAIYTKRGIAFLNGDGINKDYEQAYYWLSKACAFGSYGAEALLQSMRERSLGTPFDGEAPDVSPISLDHGNASVGQAVSQSKRLDGMRVHQPNPNKCIACGTEALEPSLTFAGARHCSPQRGGCGTNEMIPIVEQGVDRGCALQPYRESIDGRGSSYSSLGALIHMVKYDARIDDSMRAEIISEIVDRILECGIIKQLTGWNPAIGLVVVPAPSSKRRQVQPVELFARRLSENGYGFDNVLVKRSNTESKSRPRGTELAPGDVRCTKNVRGATILLVDDTYGEGATLRACIRALRDSGARTIYFLSVCKNIYGGMKGSSTDDNDIH
jgi:hypothetical protein